MKCRRVNPQPSTLNPQLFRGLARKESLRRRRNLQRCIQNRNTGISFDSKFMADNNHSNIRDEQFWFTATATGINAFVLSSKMQLMPNWFVGIISSTISAYAIYLIILRSAKLAEKIKYKVTPKATEKDKNWKDKLLETTAHLKAAWRHIPIVVFELSGSFFFVLIVLFSWIAVFLRLFVFFDYSICQ